MSEREQIGLQASLHIDQAPGPDDTCEKCGAPASAYVKHPALHGGRCSECDGIWLPGLTVTSERPIYRDEISVERTEDGGAEIRFTDADG